MDFDWDDANLDHIAAHGVSPEEAEAAFDPSRDMCDLYRQRVG